MTDTDTLRNLSQRRALNQGSLKRNETWKDQDGELFQATPKFVKDNSKYWYKPNISREEAINYLKQKVAGTFVVRESNSFPGAFGLAVKVEQLPSNITARAGDPQSDLVRHFLIEPTARGVRLKGCSNEPVFGSLAALVYQHSITALALPCKLSLPQHDLGNDRVDGQMSNSSPSQLLAQGAACHVVYVGTVNTESLTGNTAVEKSIRDLVRSKGHTTVVHFKVSSTGITLTDSKRKLFFRRHYPVGTVTFCGMDPQARTWTHTSDNGQELSGKLFGFVAKKSQSSLANACHVFAEIDPEQPASAIVNFVAKVLIGANQARH